jgi:hypothetical protein
MSPDDHLRMLRALLGLTDEALPPLRSWEEVEGDLHLRFPVHHKALVESLGWGLLGDELELYDPRELALYRECIKLTLGAITGDHCRGEAPLPGHPAPGRSLLPIAANGNGDAICLVIDSGKALEAPLWIGNVRNLLWLEVDGPVDALLLDVLTEGPTAATIVDRFGDFVWRLEPTFKPMPT